MLRGVKRGMRRVADGENGDIAAVFQEFRFADVQKPQFGVKRDADAVAARIAHRRRAGVIQRGFQHAPQLIFVFRRHDNHVRQMPQIGEIEDAVMRRAVRAHQSGAIKRERHRQILQADIMKNLVIRPLQEGRINRRDRPESFGGQPGGIGDGVLFGNADIEKPLWERFRKFIQPRSRTHRRRDGQHVRLLPRQLRQRRAKHVRIARRKPFLLHKFPGFNAKRRRAMIHRGVVFRLFEALALARDDVNQRRAVNIIAHVPKRFVQLTQIMPVNRPHVLKAPFLEQNARRDESFQEFVEPLAHFKHLFADARNRFDEMLDFEFQFIIQTAGDNAVQIDRHRPDIGRNGHFVIVQHHDKFALFRARVVQPFQR